jgi:RNA polymerase sigma factor (sigma-70 family)
LYNRKPETGNRELYLLQVKPLVQFNSELRSKTDEELVVLFRETGNNLCVGELFGRYRHLVYGVCMKYLRDEDESQDVQMHVFEKLLKDLGRHQIEQFKGWLYTVAKNECLMYLRSKKSQRARDMELKKDSAGVMETDFALHPEGVTETERQLQTMESTLQELNESQRRCLELFYLEKKCYQEITTLTGYTLNEVKSYIQNGKRNLKILMIKKQHG